MPVDFPTGLDALRTDYLPTERQSSAGHANMHNVINAILMELQTKVGVTNSWAVSSHDYRIRQVETTLNTIVPYTHTHTNLTILNQIVNTLWGNYYLGWDGAYHQTHTHINKTVLDGIVSWGSPNRYLWQDGLYHDTHIHGNFSALANIINNGLPTDFLAADGNYYSLTTIGWSGHVIQYDTDVVPVRGALNFYWAGVKVYDSAITDSTNVFIEWLTDPTGSSYVHQQPTYATQWVINHNLQTDDLAFECYQSDFGGIIKPQSVTFVDSNNIILGFSEPQCGKCVILTKGGGYGCCESGLSGYTHPQFDNAAVWNITHNLHTQNILTSVYSNTWAKVEPLNVSFPDNEHAIITFSSPLAGKAVLLCEEVEDCDTDEIQVQKDWVTVNAHINGINFIGSNIDVTNALGDIVEVRVTTGVARSITPVVGVTSRSIIHSLNKRPNVICSLPSGLRIYPLSVIDLSDNSIEVNFSAPFTGTIECN